MIGLAKFLGQLPLTISLIAGHDATSWQGWKANDLGAGLHDTLPR